MPTIALEVVMPANTSKVNAKRDPVVLEKGTRIDAIILHVPAGHQAKAPVWLEVNGSRVFPTNGRELRLDDVAGLRLPVGLTMSTRAELALVGYNEDTVDAHTTRVLVEYSNP